MNPAEAPVRFAVIGAGWVGPTHCGAIANARGARLAAVVDLVEEKARAMATRWRTAYYTDYRRVLESDEVDAVSLVTPHWLHAPMALEAFAAGKHVMTDKPVATSLAEAERVVATAQQKGLRLGAMLQGRYNPMARKIKAAVEEGKLGRLIVADGFLRWFRRPEYYSASPWRASLQGAGGGALDTQGIHMLDLLLWLAGPIKAVSGYIATLSHAAEVEDTGVAILKYASGALGVVESSTAAFPTVDPYLEIAGTAGTVHFADIYVKGQSSLRWRFKEGGPAEVERELDTVEPERHEAFRSFGWMIGQYEDFAAAIRENREPAVTGREALRSLTVLEAIYRSAREGREVEL